MSAFTARTRCGRHCAAVPARKVTAHAGRRNFAAGLVGVAAATLVAGAPAQAAEAQKLGLFPELSNKGSKGIPSTKTSADIANAPGGAKDPNMKDEVNKAQEKFAYGGGGKDPNPKFTSEGAQGKGLKAKDGEFKDVKPDSRD